jgi:heavy metal translocating P-type ATPase
VKKLNVVIAVLTLNAILITVFLQVVAGLDTSTSQYPVIGVVAVGGGILIFRLIHCMLRGEFGSDLLAGISIVTSVFLEEYLAGALVVLMLSGGAALEDFAMRRASSVLDALAKRNPSIAHRRCGGATVDVAVDQLAPGDEALVLPHEICPVDGVVIEGRSSMDESFLTGEPYRLSKSQGCDVISGAVNGEGLLVIRAVRHARDSRYSRIMAVMDESRQRRPRMRRLAETLGAWYTPLAVSMAVIALLFSGDPARFLAVLVVATPCPLIIAIPVAIIGSISWCARRGIIIRDPIVLERARTCSVLITDKTGTLTLGEPTLSAISTHRLPENQVLLYVASLEQYSKHPLAKPVLVAAAARQLQLLEATEVSEVPGQGLQGLIDGHVVAVTARRLLPQALADQLQVSGVGLECVVLLDGQPEAVFLFRDEARPESKHFVSHLGPMHSFQEVVLLSGDRDQEVRYVAEQLHIASVYAGKSPEEKVEIVRERTATAPTLYLGDGINDAPALTTATVGIAFGPRSDITSEAAGAVILEPSLHKVDQLLHISSHLRSVALQSALGGMGLSVIGMGFAAAGLLAPVWGAVIQEIIDLFAVGNALRASTLAEGRSNHAVSAPG